MNSVERVKEYAVLESEAPAIIPDKRPPPNWPAEGRIIFENYSVYYKSKEKPALRDLNFTIKAGERVGIVGRTGAGTVIQVKPKPSASNDYCYCYYYC